MHGEQIEQFILLIPEVIEFLKTKLTRTKTLNSLIDVLTFYLQINKFLQITKVIDANESQEVQNNQK